MSEEKIIGGELLQTIDAEQWADVWLKILAVSPSIPTDRGTMIGWFANAIMTGFDEGARRAKAETDPSTASLWQRAAQLVALTGLVPGMRGYVRALESAVTEIRCQDEDDADGVDLAAAVKAEREACAKIAESLVYSDRPEDTLMNGYSEDDIFELGGKIVAEKIRARSEVKPKSNLWVSSGAVSSRGSSLGAYPLSLGASPTLSAQHSNHDFDRYKYIRSELVALVGDTYYIFHQNGSPCRFKTQDKIEDLDFAFAAPVAAYLKEKGLNAGNIRQVEHDKAHDTVAYTWLNDSLNYEISRQRWRILKLHVSGTWCTIQILDCPSQSKTVDDLRESLRLEMLEMSGAIEVRLPPFDANGIAQHAATCSRCGGELEVDRSSVCKSCEPDSL